MNHLPYYITLLTWSFFRHSTKRYPEKLAKKCWKRTVSTRRSFFFALIAVQNRPHHLPTHVRQNFPVPSGVFELGNRGAGAVLPSMVPRQKNFKICLFESVARKMWGNKGNWHVGNLCGHVFLGISLPGFGFGVILEALFVGCLNFEPLSLPTFHKYMYIQGRKLKSL